MSALLQRYRKKHYELSDDLESFIHVLNWLSLKFFPHTLSGQHPKQVEQLQYHVMQIYETSLSETGAPQKLSTIQGSNSFVTLTGSFATSPFGKALDSLNQLLKLHYTTIDYKKLEEQSKEPPEQTAKEDTEFLAANKAEERFRRRAVVTRPASPDPTPPPAPPPKEEARHDPSRADKHSPFDDYDKFNETISEHGLAYKDKKAVFDKLQNQFVNFAYQSGKHAKSYHTTQTSKSKRKLAETDLSGPEPGSWKRSTRSQTRASQRAQDSPLQAQTILEDGEPDGDNA